MKRIASIQFSCISAVSVRTRLKQLTTLGKILMPLVRRRLRDGAKGDLSVVGSLARAIN